MPVPSVPLELRGVGVRFGPVAALADVDLELTAGEVLAVVGPSGCGKTSLLRAVAGLVPSSGSVHAGARELGPLPPHRRGVGVVFQDHALFPHLDVAGNVAFGLVEARVPVAERRARVGAWLERVGLADHDGDRVDALSGGERQRVALARALAPEPALVLLDEPFASLDPNLRARLSREVAALLRDRATTTLFVTHDLDEALEVGDRVAVLRAGRLVQVADPATLIDAPTDPWTARFVGHVNVWSGVEAARLPGAPAAALLHDGRVRWTPRRTDGDAGRAGEATGIDGVAADLVGAVRRRDGWWLTLAVPAWGLTVRWAAPPREFATGRPPPLGTAGRLDVPDAAWTRWASAPADAT